MLSVDNNVLKLLIGRLNEEAGESCQWMTPEELCLLSEYEAAGILPVQPWAFFHKRITHMDVSFSTFLESQKDSFVAFRIGAASKISYGRIFSIFTHSRLSKDKKRYSQTWVHVQCFPEVPSRLKKYDPFHLIKAPDAQIHLRAWGPTKDTLVKLEEIIAHCVWMMYRPGLIHKNLDIPTVALVSTDR
jgi:hypothetical protein